MRTIAIIGAGPAGLTAAHELLSRGKDLRVVVLEESRAFGGISRTIVHHGNRMDIGGHLFFSKDPEVNVWWDRMLPRQGAPAFDDKTLGRPCTLATGGPDPETTDRVMLRRNRISRILFNGKFFDYPISLKPATFANMGRFQIYNNWSPYLVKDPERTVWVGLEYFCNEGDALWALPDAEFAALGVREMARLGMIASESDALDTNVVRVKKAYPAYFDTYAEFGTLRAWLDTIPNLYCVGRNGQHRYNNMDHSMCTAFEAVRAILAGSSDRGAVWSVNTEKDYHESK